MAKSTIAPADKCPRKRSPSDPDVNAAVQELRGFASRYENEEFDEAYSHLLCAIRLGPVYSWHEIVRNMSYRFSVIASTPERNQELATLLEAAYDQYPEIVNIPPTSYAGELAEIEATRNMAKDRNLLIQRNIPSLLLVAQPKSGSVFFGNTLPNGYGLTCTTYSMINSTVIGKWAADYATGGSAYITHLTPTDRNIITLRNAGLDKIIVHIRDPRGAYLSMLHYKLQNRELNPEMATSNYITAQLGDRPLEELDDFEDSVNWIAGWIAAEVKGMRVLFTTYEESVMNREAVVDRMLEFHGGDLRYFDRERALEKRDDVDYHFRSGEAEEWRKVFSKNILNRLNEYIPLEWFSRFNWRS